MAYRLKSGFLVCFRSAVFSGMSPWLLVLSTAGLHQLAKQVPMLAGAFGVVKRLMQHGSCSLFFWCRSLQLLVEIRTPVSVLVVCEMVLEI